MVAFATMAIGAAAGTFATLAAGGGDDSISLTLKGRYAGGGTKARSPRT